MTIRRTLITLVVLVVATASTLGSEDERIWLDAKINGKSARLGFDTGCNAAVLTPKALGKFGLRFIPAPPADHCQGLLPGDTEQVTLMLQGMEDKTTCLVMDLPGLYANVDFDGVVGWCLLRPNIIQIDAVARELSFVSKVPMKSPGWTALPILTNFNLLDLEIPCGDGTNGVICIDTGSPHGLALAPKAWSRWKETHPEAPTTLETAYSLEDGFYIFEEAWADQVSFGPVVLAGVPVEQAGGRTAARWGARFEGSLGLGALKRLDLVVDGKSGLAYLRAKKNRPPAYVHNRLGAVFSPTTERTNQAVARVVEGGPAYEAGVRNGDVLLQVDQVTVSSWSESWMHRFRLAAGTKLKLVLARNGQTFQATATLRDIVQPMSRKSK